MPISNVTNLAAGGGVAVGATDLAAARSSNASGAAALEKIKPGNQSPAIDREHDVTKAVEAMNEQVRNFSPNLRFSLDQDTGKVVVKVVDMLTEEIIRQIPSEEALAISRSIDKVQGLLIKQKA